MIWVYREDTKMEETVLKQRPLFEYWIHSFSIQSVLRMEFVKEKYNVGNNTKWKKYNF